MFAKCPGFGRPHQHQQQLAGARLGSQGLVDGGFGQAHQQVQHGPVVAGEVRRGFGQHHVRGTALRGIGNHARQLVVHDAFAGTDAAVFPHPVRIAAFDLGRVTFDQRQLQQPDGGRTAPAQ